jgi:hypothetical protein
MRARTTVSDAMEPLLDVEDYNVATPAAFVHPDRSWLSAVGLVSARNMIVRRGIKAVS